MSERFRDRGESILEFGGWFYVRCPRCAGKAIVRAMDSCRPYPKDVRLTCLSCGYAKGWSGHATSIRYTYRIPEGAEHSIVIGAPCDWYFHLPLWLQTPCSGETLWAYNEEHLAFLERFIEADLRERRPNVNTSVASRLPRWMKSARNRREVLTCLEKLRRQV